MKPTTINIATLAVAFALFAGGVFALSMDRGQGRTITLACVFAALLCVAVWVTLRRMNRK